MTTKPPRYQAHPVVPTEAGARENESPSKVTPRRPALQIGVGSANLGPLEREYVNDVLDRGRLSYGHYTSAFEREFSGLHDRRFAVFCNSGTSALQVAVHALKRKYGWQDEDEVLVPGITFVASSNVILQNRLRPVFVDIDPDYYEIDPKKIAAKITPRTRAIMPVHLFGQACDMEPILALAKKHNLRVIEDSCESMFVRYRGAPVGSFGDVACFSTYVAHLIVTGVGGLALTDDPELAAMIKSLFNHGRDGIYLSIDDDQTKDPAKLWQIVDKRFSFVDIGYSYRATELEAAIGLAQLARWREIIAAHQRNAAALTAGLEPFSGLLQLPRIRPETEHAFMMYPIVVTDPKVGRDELVLFLEQNRIETRYMLPLLNQPVYRELFGDLEPEYPVARWVNENGFYIGCHNGIGSAEVEYMVETFQAFFRSRSRVLGSGVREAA
jgi:dTDP-4-amino-4,6-dideoxygalactose transaminase